MIPTVNVSKKFLNKIGLLIGIFIIICICNIVIYCLSANKYSQTQGIIKEIGKYSDLNYKNTGSTSYTTIHYYVNVFVVDGQEYTVKTRTIFPFRLFKSTGKPITVYYSEKNPNNIRDTFVLEIDIIVLVFVSVFLWGILKLRKYAEE